MLFCSDIDSQYDAFSKVSIIGDAFKVYLT